METVVTGTSSRDTVVREAHIDFHVGGGGPIRTTVYGADEGRIDIGGLSLYLKEDGADALIKQATEMLADMRRLADVSTPLVDL